MWNDRGLFIGDRSATAEHAHDAVELTIALDQQGVDVHVPQGPSLCGQPGVVVRSGVRHRLTVHGPKIVVYYFEPRAASGRGLEQWLGDRQAAPVDVAPFRARADALFDRVNALAYAASLCADVLGMFVPPTRSPALDPRVQRVKAIVQANLNDVPRRDALAAAVGLSDSRLSHLFREQMGLPLRRWVLWIRFRAALDHALMGASMTEAAFAAGFSDASHFTRTSQQMFGLPPSDFAPVDDLFIDRS